MLVDFGIARLLKDEEEDEGTMGVGTPRFMAPEVFAGGSVSPRSDVFSLAATLWTLLVGKPPVYAGPTKLLELVPDVPVEIAEAVQAGLEMIPERRVASIAAFSRALGGHAQSSDRRLAHALGRGARGPPQPDRGDRAHRRRRVRGRGLVDRAHRRQHRRARLPVGVGCGGRARSWACGCPPDRASPAAWSRAGSPWRSATAAPTRASPPASPPAPVTSPTRCSSSRWCATDRPIGVLSLLDRRDGGHYGPDDAERARPVRRARRHRDRSRRRSDALPGRAPASDHPRLASFARVAATPSVRSAGTRSVAQGPRSASGTAATPSGLR